MSKKSVISAIIMAFLMSVVFTGVALATDAGGEVLTLVTAKAKKPAVFPHKKHQDIIKCGECHHTKDADGKQAVLADDAKKEKCATCHNKDMANKKLASFQKAAHSRCKGCHKAGYEGKKGPTKCAGCHPKKKK